LSTNILLVLIIKLTKERRRGFQEGGIREGGIGEGEMEEGDMEEGGCE
jgi:hypothetical protein